MYKSLLCSFEIVLIVTAYVLYGFYFFSNRDSIFDPNSDIFVIRWLHSFFKDPNLTSLALTSTDILAFRIARLYRHLYRFPRFRAILTTLKRLYPALRSLAVILISEYYFFGLLGVCLFKGVIVKGQMSEEFMSTYWAQNNYWENNFDNLYHAFVVLFEIMIINNWNLNIEGWTVALNSHWPRVFFVCHFFLAIVIILNCVIALVLDAFISKYSTNEDLERQKRAAEAGNTVKDHIRAQKIKQYQQQQHVSGLSNQNPRDTLTSSLPDSSSRDDDFVMLEEEEQYQPYEISDESDSDDESQQLVLTLIKRADHQNTIEDDFDESVDSNGNLMRHRSFHRSRSTLQTSRSYNRSPAGQSDSEHQQQRIVFKRRTQRSYQTIFSLHE